MRVELGIDTTAPALWTEPVSDSIIASPLVLILLYSTPSPPTLRPLLQTLLQAIRGEVVVTEDLMSAINAVYDARVPHQWVFSYGGDEISWMSASLGLWFSSFTARNDQLVGWLSGGRPPCFWITGFFNPQVAQCLTQELDVR